MAIPAHNVICIDRRFWDSIRDHAARAAILFHEVAHLEGARCESCADRRAGEWLSEQGFPVARDARRGMLRVLENRDGMRAQAELDDGFHRRG